MELHTDTGKWTVNHIKRLGEKNFIYNETYQRTAVWKERQKQRLIDSILRRYSIGMLIFRKKGRKYEVLDGQQRLRTLFEFMQNKWKTNPEKPFKKSMRFNDLKKDANMEAEFLYFKIPFTLIDCPDDQIVADIFARLQEGSPLNTAEKLHAFSVSGEMKKFVVQTADKHKLFQNLGIKPWRFAHREICADFCLFEINGNLNSLVFPSFRYLELKDMYNKYEPNLPREIRSRVSGTLNILNDILEDKAGAITDKGNLLQFYFLTSMLRRYAIKKPDYLDFRDFIIEFLSKVKNIPKADRVVLSQDPYARYAARTAGTVQNLQERFKTLSTLFFDKFPSLNLKDEQRGFDIGQKIAIYYNSKENCYLCNDHVDWGDAVYHHKRFHSDGGPTTIENGALAHKNCHVEYHNKKGMDKGEA